MTIRPLDVLTLPLDALVRQCTFDAFRSSGPGGQHRNKTSSAARVTHTPTGLSAEADEHRSQQINRERAIARLRLRIALELRRPGDEAVALLAALPGWSAVGPKSFDYPIIVALVFDVLDAHAWTIFQAADKLGLSTGQLSKFLSRDDEVLRSVNRHRQRLGMKPIGR